MKLVLYMRSGIPHHKNWEGIQRMCKSCNIDFEYTNSIERLKHNNYELLYCIDTVIDPYIIPENIKIIYGPQLWVIPEPPIVGKFDEKLKDRCVFNLLSKWVEDYCIELASEFIMPISHFPFAVNTDKFKPINIEKEYDCIVYIKRRSNDLVNYTLNLLNEKDLKYKVFRYGSYNEDDYLASLQRAKFMLTLDAHESQGFALEEAMSSGTPLLVMDASSMYDETNDGINSVFGYLNPKKLLATSVPYWSDECGIKITEQAELSEAIDKMMDTYKEFTPRDYIVRTLSDEVCMKRILDYFKLNMNTDISDIFIITSVINTGNIGWSYFPQRSLFTSDQRFEQTLKSIKSIREYTKNSKIILVEASNISDNKYNKLIELCDYICYLGGDLETKNNCILSNCKGLGDSWLIYKGLEYIKNNKIKGRNIYKLSGRYELNNEYISNNISNILPTFRKISDDSYITFFFSVPFSLIELFEINILKTISIMKKSSYICIETLLPSYFKEKHIVEKIGCEGIIAVDTSLNIYRV